MDPNFILGFWLGVASGMMLMIMMLITIAFYSNH